MKLEKLFDIFADEYRYITVRKSTGMVHVSTKPDGEGRNFWSDLNIYKEIEFPEGKGMFTVEKKRDLKEDN